MNNTCEICLDDGREHRGNQYIYIYITINILFLRYNLYLTYKLQVIH